jgi:hypothetical protein
VFTCKSWSNSHRNCPSQNYVAKKAAVIYVFSGIDRPFDGNIDNIIPIITLIMLQIGLSVRFRPFNAKTPLSASYL